MYIRFRPEICTVIFLMDLHRHQSFYRARLLVCHCSTTIIIIIFIIIDSNNISEIHCAPCSAPLSKAIITLF